jgi:ubiquinone/menaquinone biosynthesis C-methylase UbiE
VLVDHHSKEKTARQFDRMSHAYAENAGHARGGDLAIVVEFLAPATDMRVIDIATGPGHTAAAVAPFVREVIATDIAPGMLDRARELARARGLSNLMTASMDAEALDAEDASFDAATCRVAPHHFLDVDRALAEVARVLRPDGVFVVEDSVVPDDAALDAFLNDLEKVRDPTHVRSLNRCEWDRALRRAGLTPVRSTVYRKEHGVAEWLATAGVDEATAARVYRMLAEATPAAVHAFSIEFDGGRAARFTDEKIIIRAEKI